MNENMARNKKKVAMKREIISYRMLRSTCNDDDDDDENRKKT